MAFSISHQIQRKRLTLQNPLSKPNYTTARIIFKYLKSKIHDKVRAVRGHDATKVPQEASGLYGGTE
jgi:hypothetical protein